MKIAVIGAGYVGLTTAACFAQLGHDVLCADNDARKLEMLRRGQLPFFEPHLADLVRRNCEAARLGFVETSEAVAKQRVIFICVGTPPLENGEADLSAIESVSRSIAKHSEGYRLIVEKSTVPVQTGRQLQRSLFLCNPNQRYDVASNPEFLREGSAVEDFFHPDRIIAGVRSDDAAAQLQEIYDPIVKQTCSCPVHASGCAGQKNVRLLITDINSAEITKHAANSFLAMKISFINLVADLCEATGADVAEVIEGISTDRRIGPAFLRPGIGFGGSCFPKDLQAFVRIAEKFGCDFSLFEEVERVNKRRVELFVEKVKKELWVLRNKTIGVWGLAYKAHTDDVRCAPALEIIRRLVAEGANIRAYDPQAMEKARAQVPGIFYCTNTYEAAESASAILALTEWPEFHQVDWDLLRRIVDRPLIFDGRNMYSDQYVTSRGFEYVGIGFAAEPHHAEIHQEMERSASQAVDCVG